LKRRRKHKKERRKRPKKIAQPRHSSNTKRNDSAKKKNLQAIDASSLHVFNFPFSSFFSRFFLCQVMTHYALQFPQTSFTCKKHGVGTGDLKTMVRRKEKRRKPTVNVRTLAHLLHAP
jgi:hypothetical protein